MSFNLKISKEELWPMDNTQQKTQNRPIQSKIILLIGGSGFIGNALGEALVKQGWHIKLLTRQAKKPILSFPCEMYRWDGLELPNEALEKVTAVINLAGESIVNRSWSDSYRQRIRESRIYSTRALVTAINRMKKAPEVVIQASAVGYYGLEERSESCTEGSRSGTDFLASVCKEWEAEALNISSETRLCIARIGVVLGLSGGLLSKVWPIYTAGLGASFGRGKQWMNWIHLDDLCRFMLTALSQPDYHGCYNLVSPNNVTNKIFHESLCRYSRSVKRLSVPKLCLKTVLGGRSQLMLHAPLVRSERLDNQKFSFSYESLDAALDQLFKNRHNPQSQYLYRKQWVSASKDDVWKFMSSASNLEKITPPWLQFKIVSQSTSNIQERTLIKYRLKLHGFPISWKSQIVDWKPIDSFSDVQRKGPYRLWYHQHVMSALGEGTVIEDLVDYQLPFFPLGEVVLPLVKSDVEKIFDYRQQKIDDYLS